VGQSTGPKYSKTISVRLVPGNVVVEYECRPMMRSEVTADIRFYQMTKFALLHTWRMRIKTRKPVNIDVQTMTVWLKSLTSDN